MNAVLASPADIQVRGGLRVGFSVDESVVPAASEQAITPRAASEMVISATAAQRVVASASFQHIGARPPDKDVVAASRDDRNKPREIDRGYVVAVPQPHTHGTAVRVRAPRSVHVDLLTVTAR
jgi:hypothetical protein